MSKQPTDFSTDYEKTAFLMSCEDGNPYLWQEVVQIRNEIRKNREVERER